MIRSLLILTKANPHNFLFLQILFDFLKNRKYNYFRRVAGERKSSFQLLVFHFTKYFIFAIKKCVACQRKSSLYDRLHFFVQKKGGVKTKWQKVTR